MRAAFYHPLRDVRAGEAVVIARGRALDPRIAWRRTAGALGFLRTCATGRVVVACPLPHVPCHVMKAIAVGGEEPDRRGAAPSSCPGVAPWKVALPVVRHPHTAGMRLISPGEAR